MSIFEYIDDILVKKTGKQLLDEYVPFLVTRWLSMATPAVCNILNETVNSFGSMDKNIHYKLLSCIFPKLTKTPRINYIKKIKTTSTDENKNVDLLAQNYELSQKEIKQLLELKELIFK